MNKAINDLLLICDVEGDSNKVGWRKRRDLMEKWIKDHVIEHETELSVVNPNVFTSDMMDFIKEKLAQEASHDLTTHTKYAIQKNKIKAKITVIKDKL